MSLSLKRYLNGAQKNTELVLLGNSQTFEVGDVVKSYDNTADAADLGAAAAPLLGVIMSICDKDGNPIKKSTNTAGSANTPDTQTVTTAADNTTSKTYYAQIETSKFAIYSAPVSGTLGTTVSSNGRGCRLDINSAGGDYGQLLETTATRTATVTANFYSHGVDPDNSSNLLVSIANHEFDSDANAEA